jgi:glycosyltransferase involved in cell wall biosynthesis
MINREEDAKEHILLFFGFVREYKGLKYLIKAMPDILAQIPVVLWVVGEFWKDKNGYLRLIKALGLDKHVKLVDAYVPNESVGKYFRSADLIVQPYVSATGSGVIQAAFGFNKPVVATAGGSLPEIVEHGKTGYLVMPKDVKALSEAIIRFFKENKYQTFSQNIANQSYRFSWDKMVDVIEHLAGR